MEQKRMKATRSVQSQHGSQTSWVECLTDRRAETELLSRLLLSPFVRWDCRSTRGMRTAYINGCRCSPTLVLASTMTATRHTTAFTIAGLAPPQSAGSVQQSTERHRQAGDQCFARL